MRHLLVVVTAALAVVGCGAAEAPQVENRIDTIARAEVSHSGGGLSIAVARGGRTVFSRGYGMADVERSVPVTPATVFHIDSVSKNILAAAVLQLVDEGKVRLDDDVRKYVPEAPTQARHVTVRQLLNHTSGIYSFTSLPDAAVNERRDLDHQQVLQLISGRPFDFEPGTRWRYNNTGFYLAGMVMERVTNQDYGAYIREHLFKRAGMRNTSLCDDRVAVPHLASGYAVDGRGLTRTSISWRLPWAAGGVCATAVDLLAWEAALDAGRVLSPASLSIMRDPTTLADGTPVDYGLGTRLGSLDGHRVLGHTGGGGGFRSVLMSFPDDHLTVVVLMNTESGSAPPVMLAADIARAALGLPVPALRDEAVPPKELAALAGVFDSDEGPVENFALGGKLHFRVPGTPLEGVLRRQRANVYALDAHTEIHCVVRDGRATWGMVYSGGLLVDAKYRVEPSGR